MNFIENIMSLIQALQSEPKADLDYCMINGFLYPLADIEKMGFEEFATRTIKSMPDKLYKFFPNIWTTEQGAKKPINHSHQALIDNTVYMQSPDNFDDIYDSDLNIEWERYSNIRLRIYCVSCACDVSDSSSYEEMLYKLAIVFYDTVKSGKEFVEAFVTSPPSEREQLRKQIFSKSVENAFLRGVDSGQDIQNAVHHALLDEYSNFKQRLRSTFRTSCFTTSPYSQLMWGGSYADMHKGFCIEYQVDKTADKYNNILYHIFPLIYCKSRPNMTERLVKIWDDEFTNEKMWDIYFHGVLRKSYEWVQQNEWRLTLPLYDNPPDYNVKFFPISKVYLGNRMAKKDKKDIIEMCKQKGVPYIGVRRSSNIFEMKDGDISCEDCPNYI